MSMLKQQQANDEQDAQRLAADIEKDRQLLVCRVGCIPIRGIFTHETAGF